jgi:hypothetical protein
MRRWTSPPRGPNRWTVSPRTGQLSPKTVAGTSNRNHGDTTPRTHPAGQAGVAAVKACTRRIRIHVPCRGRWSSGPTSVAGDGTPRDRSSIVVTSGAGSGAAAAPGSPAAGTPPCATAVSRDAAAARLDPSRPTTIGSWRQPRWAGGWQPGAGSPQRSDRCATRPRRAPAASSTPPATKTARAT